MNVIYQKKILQKYWNDQKIVTTMLKISRKYLTKIF